MKSVCLYLEDTMGKERCILKIYLNLIQVRYTCTAITGKIYGQLSQSLGKNSFFKIP